MTEYDMEKLCFSIVFTDDKIFHDNCFCELNVLLSLKTIVDFLAQEKAFTYKTRENVYSFLTFVVSQRNENYEEKIEVVNEIKGILNCQHCDEYEAFYRMEAYGRSNTKESLFPNYDISDDIQLINDSISMDYYVLTTHNSQLVSDEEFESTISEFSNIPVTYFYSLNAILREKPDIFKNKNFCDRLRLVLQQIYSKNNYPEIKKINKSIEKQIKKVNRKI